MSPLDSEVSPGGGAAAGRRSVRGGLRAMLAGPFYRAERRQAGKWHLLSSVAIGAVCLLAPYVGYFLLWDQLEFVVVLSFWVVLPALPAFLTAEGVLAARERGTLEAFLLTPFGRTELLWGVLLARVRPVVWLAIACPAIGGVAGALTAALAPDYMFEVKGYVAGPAGVAVGLVVGLFLVGEALLSGAAGIYFSLRTGSRILSRVLSVVSLLLFHGFEVLVVTAFWWLLSAPLWALGAGDLGPVVVLVLLAARVVLVNAALPRGLVVHSACHFDRWMLRERGWGIDRRPRRRRIV